MKTENFRWHMCGRHFRDYHLLVDAHSKQILAVMHGSLNANDVTTASVINEHFAACPAIPPDPPRPEM